MFGNLFKKTEPKYWLVEQPGNTMVLLLPDKFQNNVGLTQVFTIEEREKLHAIFEERVAFHTYMDDRCIGEEFEDLTRLHFYADFVSMGERFFTETNDLNSVPGYVREFEFFARR